MIGVFFDLFYFIEQLCKIYLFYHPAILLHLIAGFTTIVLYFLNWLLHLLLFWLQVFDLGLYFLNRRRLGLLKQLERCFLDVSVQLLLQSPNLTQHIIDYGSLLPEFVLRYELIQLLQPPDRLIEVIGVLGLCLYVI